MSEWWLGSDSVDERYSKLTSGVDEKGQVETNHKW